MPESPTEPGSAPVVHAVLASFPRSGRTWLAGMVSSAQNQTLRRIVTGKPARSFVNSLNPDVLDGWQGDYAKLAPPPLRLATHEDYDPELHPQNIVLLCRQPLDAMYSYFHYRSKHTATFEGEVDDFLRNEALGVNRLAKWYNSWSTIRTDATVITYEALRSDTPKELARTLDGLNMDWDCDLRQVCEQFEFSKRQKIERDRLETEEGSADELFVRSGQLGEGEANFSSTEKATIAKLLDEKLSPDSKVMLDELGYI